MFVSILLCCLVAVGCASHLWLAPRRYVLADRLLPLNESNRATYRNQCPPFRNLNLLSRVVFLLLHVSVATLIVLIAVGAYVQNG